MTSADMKMPPLCAARAAGDAMGMRLTDAALFPLAQSPCHAKTCGNISPVSVLFRARVRRIIDAHEPGAAFTDHKAACGCRVDVAHVDRSNFTALTFSSTLDDERQYVSCLFCHELKINASVEVET